MKVNDPIGAGISGLANLQQQPAGGAGQYVQGGRQGRQDQVSLSTLSGALGALQSDSPERTAKITELSAAFTGGAYFVDSHAVSGSIINESLQ